MNQKGTIKVLLLAIIAVVAIAMSGYFICNKLNNKGPLIQFIEEGNSTFKSEGAGFELKYPANIELDNQLLITVNRIDSYPSTDAPLGFDQKTLFAHQKALTENISTSENIDWGRFEKKVKLSNNTYGEESYIFGRFEVCNIVFEKRLIFFKNDYFISITLKADVDSITQSNPQYFTEYSAEGCLGWKEGGMDDFYNNINNNQDVTVKQWLSDFDSIIKSISLVESTSKQDSLLFQECSRNFEKYDLIYTEAIEPQPLFASNLLRTKDNNINYIAGLCSDANGRTTLFIVKEDNEKLVPVYDEHILIMGGDNFDELKKEDINKDGVEEIVWKNGHTGGIGGVIAKWANIYDLKELKKFYIYADIESKVINSFDSKDYYIQESDYSKDLDLEKYKLYKDYLINYIKESYPGYPYVSK